MTHSIFTSTGITRKSWWFFTCVVAALVLAVGLQAKSVSAQGLPAGEIVVVDMDAGTNSNGALFRVNPVTGNRTLVSDFGDPGQGPGQAPLGANPFVVAFAPAGLVVLVQRAGTPCLTSVGCGALFFVDPVTGARTLLSDFGNPAQGPTGLRLFGIAVDANGDLLVTDQDAGGFGNGLLFRVSPSDGTRTIVSNFADPNQGPTGGQPSGVAIEASGAVLVADAYGFVFRIDPQTGQRTIVSDFNSSAQGPLGWVIIDVEPGSGGVLWVVDQVGDQVPGSVGYGQLFRVDANTGARSVVSNFTTSAQGPVGYNQNDVKPSASGSLLVMDFDAGTNSRGALFEVDPVTGSRSYLSDFGDATQGALGIEPSGFALAPASPPPPIMNTLTVVSQGKGSGVVMSTPAGIDCGIDCSEVYPRDQVVNLVATPDSNSLFVGWGGDPDCTDGVVTMTGDRACEALFIKRHVFLGPELEWKKGNPICSRDLPNIPPGTCDEGTFLKPPLRRLLQEPLFVVVDIRNTGVLSSGPFKFRFYFSVDNKLSLDDMLVFEEGGISAAGGRWQLGYIRSSNIPPTTPPGKYYYLGVIDPDNKVAEKDEKNNVIALPFEIFSIP